MDRSDLQQLLFELNKAILNVHLFHFIVRLRQCGKDWLAHVVHEDDHLRQTLRQCDVCCMSWVLQKVTPTASASEITPASSCWTLSP